MYQKVLSFKVVDLHCRVGKALLSKYTEVSYFYMMRSLRKKMVAISAQNLNVVKRSSSLLMDVMKRYEVPVLAGGLLFFIYSFFLF